ncbi:Cobalt/zinc/cadmium efflux RND transporter, membrane fusion protein, CzcB family [hydrothermal vent metagenome]|uniref:Cobalt/zinc/cadmium efflux RND transporter, membrane fusion protein, CzcB family n=1 Tax=hydrothermal vent metagenome TaxID=652676 RepID=A0A1W1D0T7_9ZZZZ
MKTFLFSLALFSTYTFAQELSLSSKQEANWQIEVQSPKEASRLPLGEFIAEVVTPPSLLHSISLPFEANIKKLKVAKYQKVTKGEILAEVTGTQWIATQQKAIADAIAYKQHQELTKRKRMLCKEEIIPQKECIKANSQLEGYKIQLSASKALLESYGADEKMIKKLLKTFKLSQSMRVKSKVKGRIIKLNAQLGESTKPSNALFVIQSKGDLWLEVAIEAQRTTRLHEGQKVQISLGNATFDTEILQLSPVINPQNQTRQVRFLLPSDIKIFSGLRDSAQITLNQTSIKVSKKAVIKNENKQIVFVKIQGGYTSHAIEILAENDNYYFVKPSNALKNNIAISSLAILKNMLGDDDE